MSDFDTTYDEVAETTDLESGSSDFDLEEIEDIDIPQDGFDLPDQTADLDTDVSVDADQTSIADAEPASLLTPSDSPLDSSLGSSLDSPADAPAMSEAAKAADYARSFGFDRAADYIERHYDGDIFDPSVPIPITTRNMDLDGTTAENGVSFDRRTATLTDGLSVEGVFPAFDSIHHVELGETANNMSLHQQFDACRTDFQQHMYDSPKTLQDMTIGDMERMAKPQGYSPEGYTWQHNPETGSFDLVSSTDHSVGHTGGNALWGKPSGKS